MHVSAIAFRQIVRAAGVTALSPEDARALLGIAALAAEADNHDDEEERAVVDEITAHVRALAGTPVDVPDVYVEDDRERLERLRELGMRLSTREARELAFEIAYAVSISDMDLGPAEGRLLDNLGVAFGITDDRSGELAGVVAESVTPP